MAAFSDQFSSSSFHFDSFPVPSNTSNDISALLPDLSNANLQEIPLPYIPSQYEPSHLGERSSCTMKVPCSTPVLFSTPKQDLTSSSSPTMDPELVFTDDYHLLKELSKLEGEGEGEVRKQRGKRGYAKRSKKLLEEGPSGNAYVHVRARRGEATDAHSLAERVRRKKISVRMKLLQSLVPGCDQITGKALILEEIIKYVQNLQNEVKQYSLRKSPLRQRIQANFDPNELVLEDNDNIISGATADDSTHTQIQGLDISSGLEDLYSFW